MENFSKEKYTVIPGNWYAKKTLLVCGILLIPFLVGIIFLIIYSKMNNQEKAEMLNAKAIEQNGKITKARVLAASNRQTFSYGVLQNKYTLRAIRIKYEYHNGEEAIIAKKTIHINAIILLFKNVISGDNGFAFAKQIKDAEFNVVFDDLGKSFPVLSNLQ